MFDRVLLMAEGRSAFLGDAKEAVEFFKLWVNTAKCYNNVDANFGPKLLSFLLVKDIPALQIIIQQIFLFKHWRFNLESKRNV